MQLTLSIIFSASLFVLFLFSLYLYKINRKQRMSLEGTKEELTRLNEIIESSQKGNDTVHPPSMKVTVKVRDPIAVAKRASKSAKFVGDFVPDLITKKVNEQIKSEIEKSLEQHNIEADIKIEIY